MAAPPTPRPGRRRHRSPPISHTHPLSRSPSKFGNRPSSSKRALIVRCEGREIVWFTSCQVQRSLTARQQHCPTSFPATTVVNTQAHSVNNTSSTNDARKALENKPFLLRQHGTLATPWEFMWQPHPENRMWQPHRNPKNIQMWQPHQPRSSKTPRPSQSHPLRRLPSKYGNRPSPPKGL